MNTILNFFSVPLARAAANTPSAAALFVGRFNRLITNPLIVFMFVAALVYFIYGVVQFISNADKPDEREIGQQHMIWGIVGMFIMIAVFSILHLIENTLGVQTPNPNLPNY